MYDPVRKFERAYHYDLAETMGRGTHVSSHPMIRLDEQEVIMRAQNQTDKFVPPSYDELDVTLHQTKAIIIVCLNMITLPYIRLVILMT